MHPDTLPEGVIVFSLSWQHHGYRVLKISVCSGMARLISKRSDQEALQLFEEWQVQESSRTVQVAPFTADLSLGLWGGMLTKGMPYNAQTSATRNNPLMLSGIVTCFTCFGAAKIYQNKYTNI